ncbi:synaptonemal complex protein 1-like isoform X1 [Halichondria panicea]|uniref:synaptonemal complex protein 1-like isoform X1 n=1 Tax=Halichondria panicea TaxID=6063 RepID=UPI00312B9CED
MGGPLRNKQWLRIAVVLGVLLLVVYLMTSMRSGAKLIEDKLVVAELDNRDLLDKFNKLTEELKRTVHRAAETKHELEKVQKSKELEITRKDEQVKRCVSEMAEMKSKVQSVESDRDRLKSENVRLEEAKLEGATEQERLSNELDQLRLISAKDNEGSQKCKSDLESTRTQLLSAQADVFSAGEKLNECQGQLTISQSAYETCQSKVTSLEADNYNKQFEIERLQLESNTLKQQQQMSQQKQAQPPQRNGVPLRQQGFKDIDIVNDKKQKTLAELKQKLDSGHVLSEQEQQVFQMLTKNTGVESRLPTKKKIIIPAQEDKLNKDAANQNPPPPKPDSPDEAIVEDLVVEKKQENLDVKEDGDTEGGADGGDDGDEQDPQNPQDYQRVKREFNDFNDEREADFNDREDGGEFNDGGMEARKKFGNPLPDPVVVREAGPDVPNGGDTDIMDDPDGHEALRKDQQHFKKEWRERQIQPGKRLPRQHREVR